MDFHKALYLFINSRVDVPTGSTITCRCGESFTWFGTDMRLNGWVGTHSVHMQRQSQKKIPVYVASSWRNKYYDATIAHLKQDDRLDIYDFKHPIAENSGFSWEEIDPNWKNWTPQQYATALEHPVAEKGFGFDITALNKAKLCILVLPSGRSASWEYGYFCGRSHSPGIIYMPEMCEPELMYKEADFCFTLPALTSSITTQILNLQFKHPEYFNNGVYCLPGQE